jgi:hypothetical protein
LQNCDVDSIQRSLLTVRPAIRCLVFLRVIFNNGITGLMKSDNIGANQYIDIFYEMI